ncbi:putative transmembrane protein [Collimonas arenae]|uniref:hypothetical protein n=1 Tax=Collimonas arenae TaxID=279058 RepID=UPI00078B855D|nr:putative transmembrane protein [Collimonas arenae]
MKSAPTFPVRSLLLCAVLLLGACSPKFNWREVRGKDASYSVLLPAKPATFARQIDLDGTQVTMTMTAAKVDDMVFAVGSATLPDAAKAQAALGAMKTALVKTSTVPSRRRKPAQSQTHKAPRPVSTSRRSAAPATARRKFCSDTLSARTEKSTR